MSCTICLNTYTPSLRRKITCQYCPQENCLECIQRYLLSTIEDCHCHACKQGWNSAFMNANFPMVFRTKTLRNHRRTILLSREKSLLPAMQFYVEAKRNYNEASKVLKDVEARYQTLMDKYANLKSDTRIKQAAYFQHAYPSPGAEVDSFTIATSRLEYVTSCSKTNAYVRATLNPAKRLVNSTRRQVNRLHTIYLNGESNAEPAARREFIMRCQANDCRGFISSTYVCGICTKKTCSNCLEIEEDGHVCKPESVESAKAIKKETRSCPKCAARIFKIDGCDQMWCTVDGCNTAFSWNTGHIVSGRVHNPHYYEWLRRTGGGEAPREPGDIPCGGLPNQRNFVNRIMDMTEQLSNPEMNKLFEINRNMGEFEERLRDYPARMGALVNKDINVKYLMNEITENEWQRQLEFTEARFLRKKEIGQILQTFVTSGADIMAAIYERDVEWIRSTGIPNLELLREYTNEAFLRAGNLMRMAVPYISDRWRWTGVLIRYKIVKMSVPPPLDTTHVLDNLTEAQLDTLAEGNTV